MWLGSRSLLFTTKYNIDLSEMAIYLRIYDGQSLSSHPIPSHIYSFHDGRNGREGYGRCVGGREAERGRERDGERERERETERRRQSPDVSTCTRVKTG